MNGFTEDDLISCPYDSYHMISKSRFQTHLIKCQKQHPHVNLVSCFFNYSHKIEPRKLMEHYQCCPNRNRIEGRRYEGIGNSDLSLNFDFHYNAGVHDIVDLEEVQDEKSDEEWAPSLSSKELSETKDADRDGSKFDNGKPSPVPGRKFEAGTSSCNLTKTFLSKLSFETPKRPLGRSRLLIQLYNKKPSKLNMNMSPNTNKCISSEQNESLNTISNESFADDENTVTDDSDRFYGDDFINGLNFITK